MKLIFTLRGTLLNHYRTKENIIAYIWIKSDIAPHNPLAYFCKESRVGNPGDNWLKYNLKKL